MKKYPLSFHLYFATRNFPFLFRWHMGNIRIMWLFFRLRVLMWRLWIRLSLSDWRKA